MSDDLTPVTKVRPDLGVNIAVFAHLLEYYREMGFKNLIPKEGMIDMAIVAETIGNMWKTRIAEFDDLEKVRLQGEAALVAQISELSTERDELLDTLSKVEIVEEVVEEAPKHKSKKLYTSKVSSDLADAKESK